MKKLNTFLWMFTDAFWNSWYRTSEHLKVVIKETDVLRLIEDRLVYQNIKTGERRYIILGRNMVTK
jgi:hypothetical protein